MSDFDTKTSEKGEQGVIPIVQVNTLDSDHKNQGGAAVEETSPLGQQFGAFSVICLNLSMMIGTGVFSTPGSILIGTGSVGLSLVYWVIGALISWAGLAYYLELGSYFPNRAGAEVVYLEQAYKKPLYLFPAAFAASTVILSFTAPTASSDSPSSSSAGLTGLSGSSSSPSGKNSPGLNRSLSSRTESSQSLSSESTKSLQLRPESRSGRPPTRPRTTTKRRAR